MVEITVHGDKAVFEVEGWHKLWCLRSRLEIPLAHIKGVRVEPEPAMGIFDGLKLAGTDIPYVFRAGTYYQGCNIVFWDVHNRAKTIVVELEHEQFARLFVEVADPQAAVRLIEEAISLQRA